MTSLPDLLRTELDSRRIGGSRPFFGIDLGTTNSSIARVDPAAILEGRVEEAVRLIPIPQERMTGRTFSPLLPSVVAQVQGDTWWVGLGAKELRRDGAHTLGQNLFASTKSEMGLGREPFYPFAASPDYDCPWKVASALLGRLRAAAEEETGEKVGDRVVVTVPASFQSAARADTARAAAAAGLTVDEQGLLDEPNAALLDYLFTYGKDSGLVLSQPNRVLVFDFGGGTCDLSIVQVQAREGRIATANLAISRYERLGGDDIDMAVAEKHLLPRLLSQNRLNRFDLSWTEKRKRVLPQLLDVAEALKIGLCDEYRNQISLKGEEKVDKGRITASQPSLSVASSRGPLTLADPAMTLAEFEAVLEPFLDPEFLFRRDSDFGSAVSIFAPVRDVLGRARMGPGDIDAVLPLGGSSLVPQVLLALKGFFPRKDILLFPTPEAAQVAVARGAAWHSFLLKGGGRPLIAPIAQETIGILTREGGFAPLVPAGTELPFPAGGGWASHESLTVPDDLMREVQIVVAADGPDKVLAKAHLAFNETPRARERILVRYRLDGNKVLEVQASLKERPQVGCRIVLENPLCATSLPGGNRREIMEAEQALAALLAGRAAGKEEQAALMERLGDLHHEGEKYEKAVDYYKAAMAATGEPHPGILNGIGNCYSSLGDQARAEKAYREGLALVPGNGTLLFNLALTLHRRGKLKEAREAAERAAEAEPLQPAYRALAGLLLLEEGREREGKERLAEAGRQMDRRLCRTEWELWWRFRVAEALGDKAAAEEARRRLKEAPRGREVAFDPAALPGLEGKIVPRKGR